MCKRLMGKCFCFDISIHIIQSLSGMSIHCLASHLLWLAIVQRQMRSRRCLTLNIVTCQYQLFHSRANRNKRQIIFYLRFAGCSNACNEKHVENVQPSSHDYFVGSFFFIFLLACLGDALFSRWLMRIEHILVENRRVSSAFFSINIFIGPVLQFVVIEPHTQCDSRAMRRCSQNW